MGTSGAKDWILNPQNSLIPGIPDILSSDRGPELMTGKTKKILAIYDAGTGTVIKIKLFNQYEDTNSAVKIASTEQERLLS